MSIFLWDSEVSKIFVWDTAVSAVYVWDTKVRPTVIPYLCFTADTAGSTVRLKKNYSPTSVTLETSLDGKNWTTYTFNTDITLSNVWDMVYRRNTSETDTWFSTGTGDYYQFIITGSVSASGDINYLLNKNSTNTLSAYCYNNLFKNCSSLIAAPELPATTLRECCYSSMFYWCSWLTTPPVLPATTLAAGCYEYMFTSSWLTTVPELPAITLATSCYYSMFQYCYSLASLPKIYATAFPGLCCYCMFKWCSNIKLSSTQTWDYQTAYRIPISWTGSGEDNSLNGMFLSTLWTFRGTPSMNTTYYTSNTVV